MSNVADNPQTTETPPQRVMRQWYQAKLGERLLQAGEISLDRQMMRRGAKLQQDGKLGDNQEEEGGLTEDDAMRIRVGDEIHHHYEAPAKEEPKEEPPVSSGLLRHGQSFGKAALLATALASGGLTGGLALGIPWLLGKLSSPPQQEFIDTDTNTITDRIGVR